MVPKAGLEPARRSKSFWDFQVYLFHHLGKCYQKWTLNTSGYDSCVPLLLLCTQSRTNSYGYISSHSVSISSDFDSSPRHPQTWGAVVSSVILISQGETYQLPGPDSHRNIDVIAVLTTVVEIARLELAASSTPRKRSTKTELYLDNMVHIIGLEPITQSIFL